MPTDLHQKVLQELVFLEGGMWILFLLLACMMLFRAQHLDPLPLFPMIGLGWTVIVGLKLAAIWFVLTFEFPDWSTFFSYWKNTFNPVVLKPLQMVIGSLIIHYLIYAFSELRYSKKRRKLTPSTRMVFHGHLLLILLNILIHVKIFNHSILMEIDAYYRPSPTGEIYVEEPGAKTERFRMLFFH